MNKYLLLATVLLFAFSSCQKDNLSKERDDLNAELAEVLRTASPEGKSAFILPSSDDYASIPQDPKNPITAEKVELGRMLYHDPSFGMNPKKNIGAGTFSCASCHFAEGEEQQVHSMKRIRLMFSRSSHHPPLTLLISN